MMAMVAGVSAAYAEEPIKVPSGQEVTYVDVIQNAQGPEGLTYRFRFIAPAIARDGGTVDSEAALTDMAALCEQFALPLISSVGPMPSQIIISLSDRPVTFGEPAPDATQYFEAFSRDGDTCVWEGF